jgi:hypothetical protein
MPHGQDASFQCGDLTCERLIQKSRDGTVTRDIGAAVSSTITSTATPHTGLDNTSQFINFANTSGHAVVLQGIKHTEPKDGGFDHLFLYVTNSDASTSFTIVDLQAGLASDEFRIFTSSAQNIFFDGSASSHTQSLLVELIWNNTLSRWHVVSTKLTKIPVVRVHDETFPQALAAGVPEPAEFDTVDQTIGNFGTGSNTLTVPMTGIYSVNFQVEFSIAALDADIISLTVFRNGALVNRLTLSAAMVGDAGNTRMPLSIQQDGVKFLKNDAVTAQVTSNSGNSTVVGVMLSMAWQQFDADGLFP